MLDPDKLERLGRYEVHLDRKFEPMLTVPLRLKALRQGTIHWTPFSSRRPFIALVALFAGKGSGRACPGRRESPGACIPTAHLPAGYPSSAVLLAPRTVRGKWHAPSLRRVPGALLCVTAAQSCWARPQVQFSRTYSK